MPTITQFVRTRDVAGVRRRSIIRYTGPASYTNTATFSTTGDVLVPGDVFLGNIEEFDATIPTNGTLAGNIYYLTYDRTNNRVHWIVASTGADAANATNLSTFSAEIEVVGR